jgi:hypothetical protein
VLPLCCGKNFTQGKAKAPGPPSTLEKFSQLLMSIMFQNIFSIQKMFLAELWYESIISSGAQKVNLDSTIGRRKVKIYRFGSRQQWY